jgi:biofilm PGA synthesis protein PgaA
MKLTCYLKTTASLTLAFFLLLTPFVNASSLEDDAVLPRDHSRQSVFVEPADQLREQAVQSGRSGDYESAITILEQLLLRDADDVGALHDLLIILGWNEQDQQALQLAERLDSRSAPLDVLETLAKSSRNVGDFEQSARWYELAISRSPSRLESHLGLALVYADMDRQEEALRTLHAVSIDKHRRPRLLMVEAYIHSSWADYGQTIATCDAILVIEPNHRGALRSKLLAMQHLLLPEQALEIASAHPGILTDDEIAQLRSDWAAVQIRWANQTVKSESAVDKPLKITLNEMADISRQFEDNDAVQQRNRFDRIVALRTQQRMTETVSEYEELADTTEFIPAYVLRAAAGAYLHLEQPKKAQELLLRALEQEPDDFGLNHDMFYVHVDLEQHQRAMDLAENMRQNQPVWHQLPGSRVVKRNPQRMQAEITAGVSLALADQLPQSQSHFETLLARAPHNTDLRQELATVYRRRGWTNRALFEYQQVLSVEPDLTAARVGYVHALLDSRQFERADEEISALVSDAPARPGVMRLRQRWEQHNKHQVHVESSFGDSSGDQFGSQQYKVDGYFFVKPLAYRYRPFVRTSDAFAEFPEGDARRQRIGAGVEYRGIDWLGSLELNGNRNGGGEIGLSSQMEWLASDHWSLAAELETNSDAVPLRGHRIGVDADRFGARLTYRANESRQVSFSGDRLQFSDGNERNSWSLQGRQRVLTRPSFKVDLDAEIFTSNSSEQNVVYFNPSHDSSLLVTAINEWRTYRRYDFAFVQQFNIGFGYYQQDSFGTSPIGSLEYRANVDFNEGLSVQFGVRHARNVYDGESEDATFFTLAIGGAF